MGSTDHHQFIDPDLELLQYLCGGENTAIKKSLYTSLAIYILCTLVNQLCSSSGSVSELEERKSVSCFWLVLSDFPKKTVRYKIFVEFLDWDNWKISNGDFD